MALCDGGRMTGSGWLVPSPFKVAHSPRCVCSGSLWRVCEWLQYVAVKVARPPSSISTARRGVSSHPFIPPARPQGRRFFFTYGPHHAGFFTPAFSHHQLRAKANSHTLDGAANSPRQVAHPLPPILSFPRHRRKAGGFSLPTARSTRAFSCPPRYRIDSYSRLFHKRRDLISLIFWRAP